MTVEDLSNWAQASIVFWFLTKCKHCWKAKNEHVLTSGVKSWFNSFIYHLCPPFGCSDPGFLWKWVKWFEAIWTDSIQQCIVGQLIHFWTPSDEGKLLVLWKTLKKKKWRKHQFILPKKSSGFVSATSCQKFKAAGMTKSHKPLIMWSHPCARLAHVM